MSSESYKAEITDYIRRNRVSSTEVADCLGKTGAIPRVKPINRGHFVVGNVRWVYCFGETNWHLHEQIQNIEEGDILFAEAFECGDRAIFGDIVAKYVLLYQQAKAIVASANLRDAPRLIKENWPIWCESFNPEGCFNRRIDSDLSTEVIEKKNTLYQGAVAVCDDTGVVIIPKEQHNQDFLNKLKYIEEQEDIWYECIDRKKWSTFDTICLKRYADESAN